jgi:hypothetical protein
MIEWILQNYQWIFSGIGIAILAGVFRVFQIRKHSIQGRQSAAINDHRDREQSSVIVSDGSTINGTVAGRDTVVNNIFQDIGTDELVSILQLRASKIEDQLSQYYHYAPVTNYLSKFTKLHLQHISALEKNNLVLAHDILTSIYQLSSGLETDEFWRRHDAETPELIYSLSADMFQNGLLICEYLVGERSSNPEFFIIKTSFGSPRKLKRIGEVYKRIMETHKR